MSKVAKLEQRQLVVKDIPKVIKYLNDTGLKKEVFSAFLDKPKAGVESWAEFRTELGLTKEELDKIREKTRGDLLFAIKTTDGARHLLPKEKDPTDTLRMVVDSIIAAFSEEKHYLATVTLLADIYRTDNETIEEATVSEIIELIQNVISGENFPKL